MKAMTREEYYDNLFKIKKEADKKITKLRTAFEKEFVYDGKVLEAVPSTYKKCCEKCFFCSDILCPSIPPCLDMDRLDKKDIYWKEKKGRKR